MLPLHDVNPTQRRALVTILLIVVNVAVFALVQSAQRNTEIIESPAGPVEIEASTSFTFEWAAIPCELKERRPLTLEEIEDTLVRGDDSACGARAAAEGFEEPLFPDKYEWVAVLVSMFLHGSWLHLGSNMLFLWIFGNNVEDRLRPLGYVAFYLAGGVVATVGHFLADTDSTIPVVGASGAIAAVVGAYLVWFPNVRIRTVIFLLFIFFTEIKAKWLLLVWFVLQFFTSPSAGVAWVAHVAGFVFGVVGGLLIGPGRRGTPSRGPALGHPEFPGFGSRRW
ncbi:MAG: rhomboid family intramembrane serine protease [Acidimicrobiia bacterium]|nr:rhomboid family intramembrane serine protease [Acidimicrobiia bacterium]